MRVLVRFVLAWTGLSWLARRISAQAEVMPYLEEGVALYHPGERLIYRYFDGKEIRADDPLILYKRWRQVWPELSSDLKVATSQLLPDKETIPAQELAVEHMRGIFDVRSLAEGGLTDSEVEDLLWHFLEYSDRLKKDSPPSPTSSTPMGGWNGSSADALGTSSSSDSGSAEGESISAVPEPSLSESASPTVP
mgnify:CR=1 FL=1